MRSAVGLLDELRQVERLAKLLDQAELSFQILDMAFLVPAPWYQLRTKIKGSTPRPDRPLS